MEGSGAAWVPLFAPEIFLL